MKRDTNEAEIEKLEELRKTIEASPLTQKIKEEKARETLAKRKEIRQKVDQLQLHLESLPGTDEAVAELKAELSILQDREQLLKQEVNEKVLALRSEKLQIENEQGRLKTILLETSDPSIDEAIKFFQDRRETLFRKKVSSQTHKTGSNIFTMVKNFVTFSNRNAIGDALAYCLVAIHELESMKLIPVLDGNRIDELKRGIPDTDEMTEITGEKPFPRVNVDPRSLLKSDSQMDWELEKLNEDFKRLMRK